MKNYKIILVVGLLTAASLMTGCAPDPGAATPDGVGFWGGLWDGMTAGFAFIANLFGGNHGIYDPNNNGGWYDFGFLLGIGGLFGAGSGASSAR